ncbi:MocR-like pyridoxine biosynthesis transcription factor PdxR [Deinococcus cellulosilyticus]|uniref:GntR family transcriptional regulator n=1 Tax=Deinococcus cellulosilyticus (strain DSM 18568 / NBRC 106333 / KACC 11606 / 5516J-15) TaxID=1223518 RepID=A0A511MXM7_DEIC1|nr:PLP-dependent aminotransferase family protein [Deinococcus cellulosilyticus]GEM45362.1 GntR family transcriptional regulator [Deinococcus cellulosilyticus NBRC 106333 = KACC 11606]
MKNTRSAVLPAIRLERKTGVSLELQLVRALRTAILGGQLPEGARLASQRQLSSEYRVNRNVVVSALDTLQAEGYLVTVHGSGTFVAEGAHRTESPVFQMVQGRWFREVPEILVDPPQHQEGLEFRVCQPGTSFLNEEDWQRSVKFAARQPISGDYLDPQGLLALREQIADHLRRSRGLQCHAEQVLVTAGALQGIDLVARLVLQPGDGVGFENPGYRLARQVFEARGAKVWPLPVDEDGLSVQHLQSLPAPPILTYVTPSHQFPVGGRMPLGRRLALLQWAEEHDSLILEDDYDSEFRYDAPPLPALASLDERGRVVYAGSFSKVLTPELRVGYLVASEPLIRQLVRLKQLSDYHTPALIQHLLAHFMDSGALDRHIRRMRRVYGALRSALDPLNHLAEDIQLRGLEAGLHAFLELPQHIHVPSLIENCLKRGIVVRDVANYASGEVLQHGLILGYGHLDLPSLREGVAVLAGEIRRHSGLSNSMPEGFSAG